MKRTDPMSIREIIDRVMDTSTRRDEMLAMRATYLWAEIVGPGVNSLTSKRYVNDGVLHVYITSGPLKSDLSYRRNQLLDEINRILGRPVIREIRFH